MSDPRELAHKSAQQMAQGQNNTASDSQAVHPARLQRRDAQGRRSVAQWARQQAVQRKEGEPLDLDKILASPTPTADEILDAVPKSDEPVVEVEPTEETVRKALADADVEARASARAERLGQMPPDAKEIVKAMYALTEAQQTLLVTGRGRRDRDISAIRKLIAVRRREMLKKLQEMARAEGVKPLPKGTKYKPIPVKSEQRLMEGPRSQTNIVAKKLAWIHPDYIAQTKDILTQKFDNDAGRQVKAKPTNNDLRSVFFQTPVETRLDWVLVYSSLPGLSRHHWGTDVDLGSTSPKDFEKEEDFKAFYEFIQRESEALGLKQVYTPGRTGGYSEEAWHYTDSILGPEMQRMYLDRVRGNLTEMVITPACKALLNHSALTSLKKEWAYTFEGLKAAMESLDLMTYMTSINPEVQPQ